MKGTPFDIKCKIIADFADFAMGLEWSKDYFEYYNLGVPFAMGVRYGWIVLVSDSEAEKHIEQAWVGLCDLFNVNASRGYESIAELMSEGEIG